MKRLVKAVLKRMWRSTEPVRAPILRKVEGFLRRCMRPTEWLVADETNALMDHVIRELVRLQCQVESLHEAVELLVAERRHDDMRDEPAIAGEIDPGDSPSAEIGRA